jgi:DNA-binding transcriptional LysR family regulator
MRTLLSNLSDTDIRLLKIFVIVANSGGLTAAELELNIGRSTISRHLKDLEVRLGLILCRRGRAGFALTAEGQQVYDHTKALLHSLDNFRNEINEIHRNLQGKIVIAMFDKTATNDACQVPQAIAYYLAKAPEVEVEIQVVAVNQIEQGILDGRYHLGIAPYHRASSSLAYTSLFKEQMSLFCGRNHPLFDCVATADDDQIKAHAYAGLSFHSPNMDYSIRKGLQRVATANDQEGIVTLILSGKFTGFLPDHYARDFVTSGLLRKIENNNFSYNCEFAAICKKSPVTPRLTSLFMQALEEVH